MIIAIFILVFGALGGAPAMAQSRSWELLDELDTGELSSPAPVANHGGMGSMREVLSAKDLDKSDGDRLTALQSGDSIDVVLERFGQPDSKSNHGKDKVELWRYGGSVIFISESKVLAWNDAGELGLRARIRNRPSEKTSFAQDGWKSAWQQHEPIDSRAVLDELLNE